MKPNTRYECLNEKCRTYILGVGKYMDGLNCPRCNGPVVPKPFTNNIKKISDDAHYVGKQILVRCQKHCFDLTPEQVETILEIYKGKSNEPQRKTEEYEKLMSLGLLTVNEIREAEGFSKIPGGEKLYKQI